MQEPGDLQHQIAPPDDDIHQFNEVLDMIGGPANTKDYELPLNGKPAAPTRSVVMIPHTHPSTAKA